MIKHKNFLLTGIGFVFAVSYVLYKRSPTIQQALITDGYKLVSSSQNKEAIYRNILKRNEKDIDLIVLDPYLISENRRWEALSFWCDLEINNNSLGKLGIYKKFCTMAIDDDALDIGRKYVGNQKKFFIRTDLEYFKNQILRIQGQADFKEEWNKWCSENKIKPFWKLNSWLSKSVFKYCYVNSD